MKKLLFIIGCFSFGIIYAQSTTKKTLSKKENKYTLSSLIFSMPMNKVEVLKYYDKNNHICDEIPYDQVIFSSKDSSVYSIIDGEVISVADVEDVKVIIIQKSGLFYVYSNLKVVFVKKGDKVIMNQNLGYAALDLNEVMPSLDFYLCDEKKLFSLSNKNFKQRL